LKLARHVKLIYGKVRRQIAHIDIPTLNGAPDNAAVII
jgi:hypothetical protein